MGWSIALALSACTGGETDDTEQPPISDTDSDTDPVDTDEGPEMPPDPRPLTVEVSGALEQTLTFDAPSCIVVNGAPNFRTFWRGPGHVFVLVAEVLGAYQGPGVYDPSQGNVKIRLQEEAGGGGNYFASDASLGDTVRVSVDYQDDDRVWGSFEASGLRSEAGVITLEPANLPIWCPELN